MLLYFLLFVENYMYILSYILLLSYAFPYPVECDFFFINFQFITNSAKFLISKYFFFVLSFYLFYFHVASVNFSWNVRDCYNEKLHTIMPDALQYKHNDID